MAQPRCAVETELATDEAESHVVRHNNFFSDRLLVVTNLFSPRARIVMSAVSSYAESPFYHL